MSVEKMSEMSREEIIEIFKKYNFVDPLGHEMVNCVDFHELLELAGKGENDPTKNDHEK